MKFDKALVYRIRGVRTPLAAAVLLGALAEILRRLLLLAALR